MKPLNSKVIKVMNQFCLYKTNWSSFSKLTDLVIVNLYNIAISGMDNLNNNGANSSRLRRQV